LWLLDLMADVAEQCDTNKMSVQALCTVMAPNLYDTPDEYAGATQAVLFGKKLVVWLVELLQAFIQCRIACRLSSLAASPAPAESTLAACGSVGTSQPESSLMEASDEPSALETRAAGSVSADTDVSICSVP